MTTTEVQVTKVLIAMATVTARVTNTTKKVTVTSIVTMRITRVTNTTTTTAMRVTNTTKKVTVTMRITRVTTTTAMRVTKVKIGTVARKVTMATAVTIAYMCIYTMPDHVVDLDQDLEVWEEGDSTSLAAWHHGPTLLNQSLVIFTYVLLWI